MKAVSRRRNTLSYSWGRMLSSFLWLCIEWLKPLGVGFVPNIFVRSYSRVCCVYTGGGFKTTQPFKRRRTVTCVGLFTQRHCWPTQVLVEVPSLDIHHKTVSILVITVNSANISGINCRCWNTIYVRQFTQRGTCVSNFRGGPRSVGVLWVDSSNSYS